MANSLLTYVKENPIETLLTVASIHPAVRLGRFAYKGAKTLLKQTIKNQNIKNQYKVYRGEHPGNVQWSTAKGKLKGRYYFTGKHKKEYARWYATGKGDMRLFSGKVYSITLPKTQYNIAKKIAKRREGPKVTDEVNIPKQYVGKGKLELGQTLLARGQAVRNKIKDLLR